MSTRRLFAVGASVLALALGGVVTAGASTPTVLPTIGAPQLDAVHGAASPAAVRTAGSAQTAKADAADPCGYVKAVPADRFKGIPTFDAAAAAKPYTARMFTTQGEIDFAALTTKAPCTTFSFKFLAQRHYYDGTHCHRLTTQGIYVLQCGDPTGTGSGGPGYSFNDENLTGATYPAGTVAMANAGPATNGSQFFFCWKDTKLSPAYTPFGTVTKGLDTLKRIAAAGDDEQNGPGDGYPNDYTAFLTVLTVGH